MQVKGIELSKDLFRLLNSPIAKLSYSQIKYIEILIADDANQILMLNTIKRRYSMDKEVFSWEKEFPIDISLEREIDKKDNLVEFPNSQIMSLKNQARVLVIQFIGKL